MAGPCEPAPEREEVPGPPPELASASGSQQGVETPNRVIQQRSFNRASGKGRQKHQAWFALCTQMGVGAFKPPNSRSPLAASRMRNWGIDPQSPQPCQTAELHRLRRWERPREMRTEEIAPFPLPPTPSGTAGTSDGYNRALHSSSEPDAFRTLSKSRTRSVMLILTAAERQQGMNPRRGGWGTLTVAPSLGPF